MLDWDHMRFVLALGREGTLSGAARALKVDHTTVGRRLTAIEEELGTPLFIRTPKGVNPTPAGDAVIATATTMDRSMLELARLLSSTETGCEGTVRISTSEAFAHVVVRGLTGLRERHPGIRVEVLAANRAVDLTAGEADIALRMMQPTEPDLVAQKLMDLEWGVFGTPAYLADHGPLDAASPEGHTFIGFEDAMAGTPGARWLASLGEYVEVTMRCNSMLALRAAATSGLGLAALPAFLASEQPELQRVLPEAVGYGACFLVVHGSLRDSERIRAVMDYMRGYLRSQASSLGAQFG